MYRLVIEIPEPQEIPVIDSLYEKSFFPNSAVPLTKQDYLQACPKLLKPAHKSSLTSISHESLPKDRSFIICILAVPSSIKDFSFYLSSSPSDFIQECLENLLFIRTIYSSPYYNTVFLYFKTQNAADNFYLIFNGRDFSEPSNEYCYVLFISSILYTLKYENDKDWIELPTCPLCLERLDINVSGISGVIITESSNLCKERWINAVNHCKVCRVLSGFEGISCESCGEMDEVWICLICGITGCGRYKAAHSEEHYRNSGHTFTVEILSQCVWDYELDNYVHRLLHSKKGLLVLDTQFNQIPKENVERMISEYNYLINSQLEQQRILFENKIENILANRNVLLHEKIKTAKAENEYLKRKLSKVKAENKKRNQKISRIKELEEENGVLEEINKSLVEYTHEPSDEPLFEDKKSKNVYLKLQRLRAELEKLMNSLSN